MFDAAVEKRTGFFGNFLQAVGTDDFIHFHRFYSMTSSMAFYRRRRRRRRRGRSRDSFVRGRCHLVVTSSSSHVLSCVFVCVFVFFLWRENSNFQETPVFMRKKSDLKNIRKKEGCPPNTRRKRNARDCETLSHCSRINPLCRCGVCSERRC